jgi:hypothetical protein
LQLKTRRSSFFYSNLIGIARSDCGFRDIAKDREWDVAISFAGENRELAKHIAEKLELLDVRVFFDEFCEANYLGRAWGEKFKSILFEQSDPVACLLHQHHQQKIWPTFERDCFVPRVSNGEVIPVYLDDTVFPGIPKDNRCDSLQVEAQGSGMETKGRGGDSAKID